MDPRASSVHWLIAAARAGHRYHYRHKVPWRHNLIGVTALALTALGIASLVALQAAVDRWTLVPIVGVALGFCYYALIGIPVHEASHGMMFLSRDVARRKRWNTAIGWACAVPFGIHYRRHWAEGHVTHHIHPLEDDDPQAFNRLTGRPLARLLALLLLVPGSPFIHRFTVKRPTGYGGSSLGVLAAFVTFWFVVLAAATAAYGVKVAIALAYGMQVLAALNQMKGSLEHGGDIAFDPDRLLRSRNSIIPLELLLPMFFVTIYHFEHHLNYAVPWYDLPRYHRDICGLVPADLRPAIFNAELYAQLAGQKGPIPRAASLS